MTKWELPTVDRGSKEASLYDCQGDWEADGVATGGTASSDRWPSARSGCFRTWPRRLRSAAARDLRMGNSITSESAELEGLDSGELEDSWESFEALEAFETQMLGRDKSKAEGDGERVGIPCVWMNEHGGGWQSDD